MSDDPALDEDLYLWSGSGPPDPDIERLERLLGQFRVGSRSVTRVAPATQSAGTSPPVRIGRRLRRGLGIAAAATLIVAGGAVTLVQYRLSWPASRPWDVVAVAGEPTVDGQVLVHSGQLAAGGVLRTDPSSAAHLRVARIGDVWVSSGSQLELVATQSGEHRLRLRRGRIDARIWAPPRSLRIGTASATLLDLGCAFSLEVDEDGHGLVSVSHGWVSLEQNGRQSLVPEGAQARLDPQHGPGTPFAQDASQGFKDALRVIDSLGSDIAQTEPAIGELVAASRPADAITLISLLTRYPQLAATSVYDQAIRLTPPPSAMTRESALLGDQALMDAWWDALPYSKAKAWLWRWPDLLRSASSARPN